MTLETIRALNELGFIVRREAEPVVVRPRPVVVAYGKSFIAKGKSSKVQYDRPSSDPCARKVGLVERSFRRPVSVVDVRVIDADGKVIQEWAFTSVDCGRTWTDHRQDGGSVRDPHKLSERQVRAELARMDTRRREEAMEEALALPE